MTLRYRIKEALYNLKFRCQRFIRGYADEDVWGMDSWFIGGMQKILPQYIKRTDGFPAIITFEEWKDILDEMLYCINGMTEEGGQKSNSLGKIMSLLSNKLKKLKSIWKLIRKDFLNYIPNGLIISGIENLIFYQNCSIL